MGAEPHHDVDLGQQGCEGKDAKHHEKRRQQLAPFGVWMDVTIPNCQVGADPEIELIGARPAVTAELMAQLPRVAPLVAAARPAGAESAAPFDLIVLNLSKDDA